MPFATLRERLFEAEDQSRREGVVWDTLRAIASELQRLNVPYAVIGTLACQHFGYARATSNVDLLLRSESDIWDVHAALVGRGYSRASNGSRSIRDVATGIRIGFLVSGEYPGDRQPKPVRFPDPATDCEPSAGGLFFIKLAPLIEMKLASAKSAAHRIKDRADILDLMHLLGLKADFADQLDPYVQSEFRELAALPPPSEPD